MSKHATVNDMEKKMREVASPEEMARREQVASRLDAVLNRPITEAERAFWRELEADLDRERLTFR
jgi:hypothetical protein